MSDALRAALSSAVESVTPDHALSRCHPGTIATQDGQTVDLIIEDDGPVPNASSNRLVYGLPGVSCSIKTGERVRMQYENGDPRKPIACGFDPFVRDNELPVQNPPVTEINFCGAASNQGAARNGDSVGGGSLVWVPTPPAGPVPTGGTLTYTAFPSLDNPTPTPIIWSVVGAIVITQISPPSAVPTMTIGGAISGGSAIVKIGG